MKLTYEQLKHLAEMGEAPGKMELRRNGKIQTHVKMKWSAKTGPATSACSMERQKECRPITVTLSHPSPRHFWR